MFATPLADIVRPAGRHTPAQLKIIITQLTFEVVARGELIQFYHDRENDGYSLALFGDGKNRVLWRVTSEPDHMQLLGCAAQLYTIVAQLDRNELQDRWDRLASRLSLEELDLIRKAAKEGYL